MSDIAYFIMNDTEPTGNASAGQGGKMGWSSLRQLSSEKVTVVIKCTALLLIGVSGAFGNTLTLIAIRKTPRLWTKSNTLLAALTATNLYMSVIQLPYFAVFNLWVYVFADSSCYYKKAIAIMYPIPKTTNYATYCLFIAIAADRYMAIIYPLHYETKMTVTVIKCLIGGSFVCGLTFAAIFFSYLLYIDWSTCGIPYSTVMTAVIDCGMYTALALVTIFVYGRILLIAQKHRSKISSVTITGHDVSIRIQTIPEPTGSDSTVVPGSQTGKPKIKKPLSEFKAASMTAVLVCAYTLPLLPYEIGRALQGCGNMQPYTAKLIDVGGALGNINPGFDWVIYGVMNRTFRRAYMRILKIKTDDLHPE